MAQPHINANDANDSIELNTLIIVDCCAKTTTATSTHSPQHAYVVLLAKLLLHALHTFVAVTVIVTNQFLNCKSFGKAYSLTKKITLSSSSFIHFHRRCRCRCHSMPRVTKGNDAKTIAEIEKCNKFVRIVNSQMIYRDGSDSAPSYRMLLSLLGQNSTSFTIHPAIVPSLARDGIHFSLTYCGCCHRHRHRHRHHHGSRRRCRRRRRRRRQC
ncbi:hypothetical protein GQX74_003041 [Glossina fuscipes]|nr:hypothetical protein GQX74_003041 [Glossina fuscipes]